MNKENDKPIKHLYTNPLFWIILVLLIVIISSKGKADSRSVLSPEKDNTPALSAAAGKKWSEVKTWSGVGIKKTEPFTITGDKWRIKWSNIDDSNIGSLFQGYVMKPGKEIPSEVFGNSTKDSKDETYVYSSGDFYLSINSANSKWSVIVEEYK